MRPDVVLLSEGDRDAWVIVEVQLARDDDRQRRWLAATAALLDARGAMGDLVVIPESPGFKAIRVDSEARGETRGKAIGEAHTLLNVLQTRGLFVADASRERIERCEDTDLTRWIARAVTATEPR